ncbi:MAG: M48 family metallopeptidase [Candidatus Methylomirabilia bacterium]
MNGSGAVPFLIAFGKESIPITIAFSDRRGLKISVLPDRSVVVSAPVGKAVEEVIVRVRRRASWIVRQREYFERFSPIQPPREYVAGETHRYLGRQLRLKLVRDSEESVKLLGKFLVVRVAKPSDQAGVKLLVEGWFKEHGRKVIVGRYEKCFEQMQKTVDQAAGSRIGTPHPLVRFQKMEKRWGSCSRKGTIVLNTELAKASVPCIDYVLFHELCHLKYPHHGKEFYGFLARFVPDWRKWKERLEMVTL